MGETMGLNKAILFDQFNQSPSEEAVESSFRRMERRDDGHEVERQTIFGLRLHYADPDGSRRRPVALARVPSLWRGEKLRGLDGIEIILIVVESVGVGALRCSESLPQNDENEVSPQNESENEIPGE